MENNILLNYNRQPIYNLKTKEFLLDFDPEQKKVLLDAIKINLDISAFAYTYLPPGHMQIIINYLKVRGFIKETDHIINKISDIDIWKLAHTILTEQQLVSCLRALTSGVDLFRIPNFSTLDPEWIDEISMLQRNNVDSYDYIKLKNAGFNEAQIYEQLKLKENELDRYDDDKNMLLSVLIGRKGADYITHKIHRKVMEIKKYQDKIIKRTLG